MAFSYADLAREMAEYNSPKYQHKTTWVDDQKARRHQATVRAQKVLRDELRITVTSAVRVGIVAAYQDIARELTGKAAGVRVGTEAHTRLSTKAQAAQRFAGFVHTAKIDPKLLRRANVNVMRKARRSVLASYGYNVTRKQSAMSRSGYRAGQGRMANGALRRALGKPSMYKASADYLYFIDWQDIDKEAAHWYRLNFGAGARGRNSRQGRYNMLIEGRTVMQLGLATGPSVNPVVLPPGFFVNADGGFQPRSKSRRGLDAFFPASHKPGVTSGRKLRSKITAGIEARNFLDAGIKTIARELPREYDEMFRNVLTSKNRALTRATVDEWIDGFKNGVKVDTKPTRVVSRYSKGAPLFGVR